MSQRTNLAELRRAEDFATLRKDGLPNLARHLWAMEVSDRLRQSFCRMHRPLAHMIDADEIIDVLNKVGVRPVLMGTHALNTWRSEPRATQDVDILVRKKDIRKAVRALREAYPDLQPDDLTVVTRFIDPASKKSVIDVMKPTQEVFRVVFRNTVPVGDTHDLPKLEMALVSKFAAMVSPNRIRSKKLVDVGDFSDVVENNRDALNLQRLRELGDKVYLGGGAEIIQLVEDILAGRPIQF